MINKISELFSAMLGHPEGRERATPISRFKIITRTRLNILDDSFRIK